MIYAQKIDCNEQGIRAEIVTPWGQGVLSSPMLGAFNGFNLLVTLTVLNILEMPFAESLSLINQVTGAPGRMQVIRKVDQPTVVIDFAHTPDALQQVLSTLKQQSFQRVWCVFGCGGDRDPGKRAPMGSIAEQFADEVVLTSDNPRSEAPQAIMQDILQGVKNSTVITVIEARADAINYALTQATARDVILIAGKGHETYQEIQGQRYSFSDTEVVEAQFGS